jgi:phosphatidylglycerol:prolipoprotein diacylglycerol transferase
MLYGEICVVYPILLKIGFFEIHSYYVFWSIALITAMLWTNKRTDRSGLPVREVSFVISWAFIGMILGSRIFEYVANWKLYYDNPGFFLDINRGGISEVGAAVAAMIVAFIMCKVKKISYWSLADIVSPAALLTIAIGRWGCYLNGCCVGIDKIPVQLYYSFTSAVILIIVLTIENYNRRKGIVFKYGIVSPIAVGLYSISRLFIDNYRVEADTQGIIMSGRVLIICVAMSLVWLIISIKKHRSEHANR